MTRDTTTGIRFEKETDLFKFLLNDFTETSKDIFSKDGKEYVNLKGHKLYTFLEKNNIDYKQYISRKLLPDECVYDKTTGAIHIFEKKFQQTQGSADEKLQTCDFKKKQYEKLTRELGVDVNYTYILSDWFKQDMYKDVLMYIESVGCSYKFVDNFYTYSL